MAPAVPTSSRFIASPEALVWLASRAVSQRAGVEPFRLEAAVAADRDLTFDVLPPAPCVFFAAVLCFSALVLRSEVDRVLGATGLTARPLAGPPGVVLDWVGVLAPGGSGGVVTASGADAAD